MTATPLDDLCTPIPALASFTYAFDTPPMDAEPQDKRRLPPPWSTSAAPPWSTATRPLSDIRELTEPSLADISNYQSQPPIRSSSISRKDSLTRRPSLSRKHSLNRKGSLTLKPSMQGIDKSAIKPLVRERSAELKPQDKQNADSPGSQTDRFSAFSLKLKTAHAEKSGPLARKRSLCRPRDPPPLPPAAPRGEGFTIPSHGRARSPIKGLAGGSDPLYSDFRRVPSRTFQRPNHFPNIDILDFPCHRHPRVTVELHIAASLFVGGGTIEGHVRVVVEEIERIRHRRQLAIGRISVDLLGAEEMTGAKRHIFINLATELIDSDNPPPHTMVESLKQISPLDPFWHLAPSTTNLPFALSLPLDVGPPPFHSKNARIRYILCTTVLVRDQGKQYLVRTSQEISALSVYDPEKALMSLPSPLTASDGYVRHSSTSIETLTVTAGLHRQVWVSGTTIFVDVHIVNNCKKSVKRVELQMERDILCYKHAAASTLEKSASQARIFDHNERTVLSKAVLKQGSSGWNGVAGHSSDVRTCDLELPRGHATVKCGKYFEVRYFLNIIVGTAHTRLVTVQLPIVLIHMNSLDVVPNSVAQVAAAIEEKRAQAHNHAVDDGGPPEKPRRSASAAGAVSPRISRRPSSAASVQGRAFAAPRKQSLERARAEAKDLNALSEIIYSSPRKYLKSPQRYNTRPLQAYGPPPKASPLFQKRSQSQLRNKSPAESYGYHTPPSHRKGRVLSDELSSEVREIRARLRRMRSTETSRSIISASGVPAPPPRNWADPPGQGPGRGDSGRRSAGGFRELEIDTADRGRGTGGGASSRASSAHSRFDQHRQFQFRKMRSAERWKGAGSWFSERTRERERDKDKEEKQRMLANWI